MLLGFKKRFIEPIQKGTKVFTLRKQPKRMPKIGERLYMYSALRTKHCTKITDKETLRTIQQVTINILPGLPAIVNISVNNRPLTPKEVAAFVRFDGFNDTEDFHLYWIEQEGTTTATLVMFGWTDLKY